MDEVYPDRCLQCQLSLRLVKERCSDFELTCMDTISLSRLFSCSSSLILALAIASSFLVSSRECEVERRRLTFCKVFCFSEGKKVGGPHIAFWSDGVKGEARPKAGIWFVVMFESCWMSWSSPTWCEMQGSHVGGTM